MRYFFHLEHATDTDGVELESLAEAKCEAARRAGKLLCEVAERFRDSGEFNMSVSDENGLVLFTLVLSTIEAPAIMGRPVH
jgi:hypothetical protein